ncbi:tetratricopeptide repeat protein [Pseudobacteriovorax antillogorgiicola]|uniref:Uncharacterized protein n=1 Tax=Pseudobacteriovorax antillogorgiicola TaxID=1513793 RepID=A0A1Y6CJW0_9BACT|nr:tetratricopeptide repeat protein [Pseudobacteriovorax antillogorgiicola]TCS46132.1 hypothetical protein EDD56_12533 [Pseudobacteriovorax antillogorgiicola]SMF69638.1 hypothetical protein SAMN06296036_12533 [Pseudobacteriovorax antillogorgiicola]
MKYLLFYILMLTPELLFARGKALKDRSIDEILSQYMIVGDFSAKASLRDNSQEIFWRYPIKLARVNFPIALIDPNDKDFPKEFPRTDGHGRAIEHLNRGRVLFLKGEYEEARKTWLGGRARYGTSYDYHRRNDYFIANSFLFEAMARLKSHNYNYDHEDVRGWFVNASTFFSWSYGVKKDIPDPVLDQVAPKAFYNLSAIYFTYERWAAAFGSVDDGFAYLRRTGRKEYRTQFRRMKAELFIRNRDYLSAVQQLDIALRQDRDVEQAALIFARIGDIYFDLNNFELAEDMYSLAIRLDHRRDKIRPWQFILRGECLFWLGKFDEAIKMMNYGLASLSSTKVVKDLPFEFQALASIRIADSYLALGKIEDAKLAYYRHIREFRAHETLHVAKLREACLELPFYQGNNIEHSRKVLNQLKEETTLPIVAQELVWTCEMASYAQHDRSPQLVERVRNFYSRYPRSEFLKSLVEPVRDIQARNIESYFDAGDIYGAVGFFEQGRRTLFPKVPDKYKKSLFEAYVDMSRSEPAKEFYDGYKAQNDAQFIRKAVMLSEVTPPNGNDKWANESQQIGEQLQKRDWTIPFTKGTHLYIDRILSAPGGPDHYLWIYDLASTWVEENFGVACDIIYPVLQRLGDERSHFSEATFKNKSKDFIATYLEDMLKYETFCAYSVLEFELELFKSDPTMLGKAYLNRGYLPVNNVTAALFYSLAEMNYDQGDKAVARALWQKIVKDGDDALPEVRYARSRLDTRRTELEKLWE